MALKQIDHGSKEYKQMVALRMEILRKPLGLNFTEDELAREKEDILIGAFDEEKILACCLLTKVDNATIKLRQMAVQNNLQGKGIGASMMSFAETVARDKGYRKLTMHARNTAIGFYEKFEIGSDRHSLRCDCQCRGKRFSPEHQGWFRHGGACPGQRHLLARQRFGRVSAGRRQIPSARCDCFHQRQRRGGSRPRQGG